MLTFDCKYTQDSVAQTICENSSPILKVGIGLVGGAIFLKVTHFPPISGTTKMLALTSLSLVAGSVYLINHLAIKAFTAN